MFSYKSEILSFLGAIAHNEGESQATHFVRELTGIGIKNEEKFGVALPPYHIKRKIYKQYCWENGWKAYTNATGGYKKLEKYDLQPNDDE